MSKDCKCEECKCGDKLLSSFTPLPLSEPYSVEYNRDFSLPEWNKVKPLKYHWFEIMTHNILKLFWIESTMFNINEELHAKSKDL